MIARDEVLHSITTGLDDFDTTDDELIVGCQANVQVKKKDNGVAREVFVWLVSFLGTLSPKI